MYAIRCKVRHHGVIMLNVEESNYIILVDNPSLTGSFLLAKEAMYTKFPLYSPECFIFSSGAQAIEGNLAKEKVKIIFSTINNSIKPGG